MKIKHIHKQITSFSIPHKMIGLQFGTRMTAIVNDKKEILLYSPIEITDEVKSELAEMGQVKYILAPNMYHHLFAGHARREYQNSILAGPEALAQKRKDLTFDLLIKPGSKETMPWQSDFDTIAIAGQDGLNEIILFHRSSKTLLCCDLIQNVQEPEGWLTRFYMRFIGKIYRRPGLSRPLRLAFKDRKKARASIDSILQLDFNRIILSHGRIIEENAKQVLTEAYTWLKS